MPNTKEVEQIEDLFIEIMAYQMDYVELARSTEPYKLAEKGVKLIKALSNHLEQSENKEEWVSVETVILVAMGFNQSVYNNTTYFFHKDIVEINLKVYGNTYWVRFRDQDIKPIKNIGDLKSTVFAMTGKTL